MPLLVAFDGFAELSKRVSPTCLIRFERNRCSVPASFAYRPVSRRIYPDRLVVAAENNIPCEHTPCDPTQPSAAAANDLRLAALSGRPSEQARGSHERHALRGIAICLQKVAGSYAARDRRRSQDGRYSRLRGSHHHEQAVLTAVELALTEGIPTKTHVLNLLHRLIDGKRIGSPDLDMHLPRWLDHGLVEFSRSRSAG